MRGHCQGPARVALQPKGGGVMLAIGAFVLHLLGTVAPGLATTIGDIWIKSRQTQVQSDANGVSLSHSYLESVTEANRSRVEARKNEGPWGPLGLITIGIGSAFIFHVWGVVLDSTPLFGHVVGSWGVSTLGRAGTGLDAVEMEAIRALFYTAPPAAAAVAVARVFRR